MTEDLECQSVACRECVKARHIGPSCHWQTHSFQVGSSNLPAQSIVLKWLCVFLTTLATFSYVPIRVEEAAAQPKTVDATFEALKARYIKLKNTDIDCRSPQDWFQVGEELERYANAGASNAPAAWYFSGLAFERLARAESRDDYAARAQENLSKLVERYPADEYADDALVLRGDLLAGYFGKLSAARADYLKVLSQYPKADQRGVAQQRLRAAEQDGESDTVNTNPAASSGFLVAIDPGHGGEDKGALGVAGLLEKDIVFDLSLRLEQQLKSMGMNVQRTRSGDEFVPLAARTELVNQWGADVFVSLHTNASLDGESSGLHVYYLDTAGDEAARLLAERENGQTELQGAQGDLQFMLGDLMQNAKASESRRFAHIVADALKPLAPKDKKGRPGKVGVKKAPFYVLVGAHMPCVLIELLFIDSAEDARKLANNDFRDKAAVLIANAIRTYRSTLLEHSKKAAH